MIIVKLTLLLMVVTLLLIVLFEIWQGKHIHRAIRNDFPLWAYLIPILTYITMAGVLISTIWLLFFYW